MPPRVSVRDFCGPGEGAASSPARSPESSKTDPSVSPHQLPAPRAADLGEMGYGVLPQTLLQAGELYASVRTLNTGPLPEKCPLGHPAKWPPAPEKHGGPFMNTYYVPQMEVLHHRCNSRFSARQCKAIV